MSFLKKKPMNEITGVNDLKNTIQKLQGLNAETLLVGAGIGGFLLASDSTLKVASLGLVCLGLFGKNKKQTFKQIPIPVKNLDKVKINTVTDRLGDVLLRYFTANRCDVLETAYFLTNAELAAVYNSFYQKNQITLRDAINDLYYTGCMFEGQDYATLLLKKISTITV